MAPKKKGPLTEVDHKYEITKIKLRITAKKWDGFFGTIKEILRIGPWCAAAAALVLCTKALAGQSTNLHGALQLLVDLKANEWIPMLFGGTAVAAYIRERRSHQKTLAQAGDYQRKLEQQIDPDRSSSRLLPSGQPRKEDRE